MKLGLELYPHLLIRQVASVALYHARTLSGATCATWVWQLFFCRGAFYADNKFSRQGRCLWNVAFSTMREGPTFSIDLS